MSVAVVVFRGADKGGLVNPPISGYRPQIDVGYMHTSCIVEGGDDGGPYVFDKEHLLSIRLMFPDHYPNALRAGQSYGLYEGGRLVGTALIVEL